MSLNRRDFLLGHWAKEIPSSDNAAEPDAAAPLPGRLQELPSDFNPALIKMQARIMGLNVESMTDEEVERAVLDKLNEQIPPA